MSSHGALLVLALLLWTALATAVGVHASNRGRSPFLWATVTVLTGLLGVAVYAVALLAGADDDDPVRVCPACSARHESRPAHCPDCGEPLDESAERLARVLRSGSQGYCSNCKSRVALDAEACPHCDAVF